jgi:hypothetical protein
MVGKAQKSHGAGSQLNSVFGLEKVDRWNSIRTFAIQSCFLFAKFLVQFSILQSDILTDVLCGFRRASLLINTGGSHVVSFLPVPLSL